MASARELLEQADALMRKNRTRADADIPVLTEAVALVPVPVALPMPPPAAAAAAPLTADVPVLTDAVDEGSIDFNPRTEPPAALVAIMEGDPSDWLVMDTVDPASHSITGRAPDTLAVVPPMTLRAAGSAATPPPAGSQPRPGASPDDEPDWLDMPQSAAFGAAERAPAAPAMPSARESAPVPTSAPVAANVSAAAPLSEFVEDEFFEPASSGAVFEPLEDEPIATSKAAHESLPAPALAAAPERAPPDDEHWRALSEQISMQVLQRLDLFTDSGLKEQLAQRLRPIVDRASAELVSGLTEHVGRLVRTYVSEAIEREIAQWKQEQR